MRPTFLLISVLAVVLWSLPSIAADPPSIQLPDTTPSGKPHFDSKGAMVGDELPNFPMRGLDGKPTSLGRAWSDGTTLLLTSSYTCPKSRASYPRAAELARRMAGHAVHVAVIYVIEAHPMDDPSPYSGKEDVTAENRADQVLCRQPTTIEGRLKLANDFSTRLKVDLPIFVDPMANEVWATLGGGPNMGVLVDRSGIVLARQGWFDAKSMEMAINAFVAALPKPPSTQPDDRATHDTNSALDDLIKADNAAGLKAIFDRQPELEHRRIYLYPGTASLLQVAANDGSSNVIELLIKRGADVNAQTTEVPSPLHLAADKVDANTAKLLIKHGANVNLREFGHGPVPLQIALYQGNAEVAALLVEAGAKPNFYTAAATGDLDALQAGFLHDPTILMRPDGIGRDALTYAVKTHQMDSVKLLLSLGARGLALSSSDREFFTIDSALSLAIYNNDLELTRTLLDHGSDPNWLVCGIGEKTPIDFVRLMLDHKADPNFTDKGGLAPVLRAIVDGRRDILQMLLDAGADINVVSKITNGLGCGGTYFEGGNALLLALENHHDDMVEFLLKKGVRLDVEDETGETPLGFVARWGEKTGPDMARLLIAHHADVNAVNSAGLSPIFFVCENEWGNPADILRVLIDNHVKTSVTDRYGNTPLHFAASNTGSDAEAVVRLLIAEHVDVNAVNKEGLTPLDFAEEQHPQFLPDGNTEIAPMIDLLKKHGAVRGKPLTKKNDQ